MRRVIWGEVWTLLRRNPLLPLFLLAALLVFVAISWWEARSGRPFSSGFILGGGLGAIAFLGLWMLSYLGYLPRLHGIGAELETRKVLRKVPADWEVQHNVMVGMVDVDHVVVAPGRVYCIESKWSSALGLFGARRTLANQAAHRASEFAKAHPDILAGAELVPVLMLHGNAHGALEGPQMIGRTRVVHSSHDLVTLMRRAPREP